MKDETKANKMNFSWIYHKNENMDEKGKQQPETPDIYITNNMINMTNNNNDSLQSKQSNGDHQNSVKIC